MRKTIVVNKSLKKEVTFMGLKAKYIYYCAYIFVGAFLFSLFATSILGMFAVVISLISFFGGVSGLLYYSKTFGENGWIKKQASKNKPNVIRVTNTIENILWESDKIS